MRRAIHIILMMLICVPVLGQIKYRDLKGEWTINNQDNSYYFSDTLRLYQDINYQYELKTCSIIQWKKEKRQFRIIHVNTCAEPNTAWFWNDKETIHLKNLHGEQIIELRRNNKLIESFYILDFKEKRIDRYPYDIKIMTLKRKTTSGNKL